MAGFLVSWWSGSIRSGLVLVESPIDQYCVAGEGVELVALILFWLKFESRLLLLVFEDSEG